MMKDIFQKTGKTIFCNLPNAITAIGIILTVWLNALLWNEPANYRLLILCLVVGVGISDLLDGWMARQWQIVTSIGDFLDKARDKFFSCSIFVYFLKEFFQRTDGIWLAFVKGLIVLILVIEFFLLLIWIIGFIKGLNTDTHWTGKAKTNFYFVAIGWWFLIGWLEDLFQRELISYLYGGLIPLLFIGSVFGILSVVAYLQRPSYS
jgi:phosphatidylglycerophosphate synthase